MADWLSLESIPTLVAVDIETTGLTPFRDQIQVIAIHYEGQDQAYVYDTRDEDVEKKVADLLRVVYEECTLVLHNAAFDLSFIQEHYRIGYPTKLVWDTMLAERLLTAGLITMRSSLKDVAQRRLGVTMSKEHQTSFGTDEAYTPEQIEYAALDTETLIPIAIQQKKELQVQGLARVWEIERRAIPVFSEMDRVGVQVDRKYFDEILSEDTRRRDELEVQLKVLYTLPAYGHRIEKFEEALEERRKYYARRLEQENYYRGKWKAGPPPNDVRQWKRNQWDDLSWNTTKDMEKGCARYIDHYLKMWREENPIPPVAKMDSELVNLNSPIQMVYAFNKLGFGITDTQSHTINGLAIDAPDDVVEEYIDPYLEYKQLSKRISAFGEPLLRNLDDQNRLHGSSWQIGTATGRPTKTEPNLYQMPKAARFRRIFIPGKGKLMLGFDYSQFEMRLVAAHSGDKVLINAFNNGLDLHTLTAARTYYGGVGEDEMSQVNEDQRKMGKIANFGTLYGMWIRKYQETLAKDRVYVSKEEAERNLVGWRDAYPEAASWIEETGKLAVQQGWTATKTGRKRFFDTSQMQDKWDRGKIERQGANHPIQGGNADVTKIALGNLWEKLEGTGANIVLQVYDEIVVECPYETAYDVAVIMRDVMEDAARELLGTVPAVVDGGIGTSWAEDDMISIEDFYEGAMNAS